MVGNTFSPRSHHPKVILNFIGQALQDAHFVLTSSKLQLVRNWFYLITKMFLFYKKDLEKRKSV